jgi:nucleoside-diphosphate-sugar epimerase
MTTPAKLAPSGSALPCPPDAIDAFLGRPTPKAVTAVAALPGPFLVLGAGGKIGLHLCVMLRQALTALGRQDDVIAVSRFQVLRDRADFEQHGILTRACDLTDTAALATLPDAPTVFFLAGVKFGTASAPGLLQKANIEMPRLVAHRFRSSRIVAFSSGCVYPFVRPSSGGATEDTPVEPIGDYAASCVAREEAFAAAAAQHGMPVALIRLNYSVEFRYGLLVDIAEKVLRGQPVDVTTGYFNAIWQRDAVAHTIQSAAIAANPPRPINITGAEVLSVRRVAQRFGELLQRPVQFVGQEADTAWLNNASRSHALFGSPVTSVEEMMGWIAAWLTEVGVTWGKPTGFERRDGQF